MVTFRSLQPPSRGQPWVMALSPPPGPVNSPPLVLKFLFWLCSDKPGLGVKTSLVDPDPIPLSAQPLPGTGGEGRLEERGVELSCLIELLPTSAPHFMLGLTTPGRTKH